MQACKNLYVQITYFCKISVQRTSLKSNQKIQGGLKKNINTMKGMKIIGASIAATLVITVALLVFINFPFNKSTTTTDDKNKDDDYFTTSLYDIYSNMNERAKPFHDFNSKFFRRVNPLMKQSQFNFHGKRDPLIVVYSDMHVYFYNRTADFQQYGFDPVIYNRTYTIETYDILKAFGHSTLYLYYRMSVEIMNYFSDRLSVVNHSQMADSKVPLNTTQLTELNDYLSGLNVMEQELDKVSLCDEFADNAVDVKHIQHQIASKNRQYVQQVIHDTSVTFSQNEHFAKSSTDLLLNSTSIIARLTISHLNHLTDEWKVKMNITEEEFQRTRVIVIAGSSPRVNCLQSQAMRHLLNQHRMGDRVIYAENMWTAQRALDRLKAVMADHAVGEAFFNDRYRMLEDLLADAARDYLKKPDLNMNADYQQMIKSCPHLKQMRYLNKLTNR